MEINNDYFLPEDISIDILSRLPTASVLRCSLVRKSWRNLIFYNREFARMHLLRGHHDHHGGGDASSSSAGRVNFLLLLDFRYQKTYKLYNTLDVDVDDDDDDYEKSKIRFRELKTNPNNPYNNKNYYLVGSCNGLICMAYDTKIDRREEAIEQPIYVTNPITGEWLTIPTLIFNTSCYCLMLSKKYSWKCFKHAWNCNIAVCGFGYLPSTNEYKVVRIYYYLQQGNSLVGRVHLYTLGDGNGWRDKGEIPYTLHYYITHSPSVLANGALHWLDEERVNVVAFDLADEVFSLIPSPQSCFLLDNEKEYSTFQLKVLGGQLCAVFHKDNFTVCVWVLKKNGNYNQDGKNNGQGKYQFWSWIKELDIKPADLNARHLSDLTPFILTKQGDVLCYSYNKLFCYELKTATSKKLVDMQKCFPGYCYSEAIIPHLNSFISLKSLGKEEEEEQMYRAAT